MSLNTKKEVEKAVTFKHFLKMVNEWNNMTAQHPEILSSKFGYAAKRFFSANSGVVFDEYNVKLSTIRIENALVNEVTQAVLTKPNDTRGFEYDRYGLVKVIQEERKLEDEWNSKEFKVTPFITNDIGKLDEIQKELFAGYVV